MSSVQATGQKPAQRVCVLNVGLPRTGTTTLASGFEEYGLQSQRWFPQLSGEQLRDFLLRPAHVVKEWARSGGFAEIVSLCAHNDYVCDGWCPLLPFLSRTELDRLTKEVKALGTKIQLVATTRDLRSLVKSELHHWVVYNLEDRSLLSPTERSYLEDYLRDRALKQMGRVDELIRNGRVRCLPLVDIVECWPNTLSGIFPDAPIGSWKQALQQAGTMNANPTLPLEGILLTLRLGSLVEAKRRTARVERLLGQLELDTICQYLVVLAIDADEEHSRQVAILVKKLRARIRNMTAFKSLTVIVNPKLEQGQPFPICSVWNEMAIVAWQKGADWVVLFGDDIEVRCPFHYRAFYRKFIEISDKLHVPFGFGCPWWNDETFPDFPSFPCVGKAHFDIFGGLIPQNRHFVNQDLDPYLHRLYSKFWASPCVKAARLSNTIGGEVGSGSARYVRVPQSGWKDFAIEDVSFVRNYIPRRPDTREAVLVDVVVPSYRVQLDYLTSICSLQVPTYMQTIFIIIIDNPEELLRVVARMPQASTLATTALRDQAERILEDYLVSKSAGKNTVRVRCNNSNLGASGSRNRGLDESAADFVLNLDDDLIPHPDLLAEYGKALLREGMTDDDDNPSDVVGLIGLVRFPRSPTLPLRHAAVLMSYLTFMFEIAEQQDLYPNPAWGVTANILFRRNQVRFDLAYAKSKLLAVLGRKQHLDNQLMLVSLAGGGEDVDYALRVSRALGGGTLVPVPLAKVVHPFWPGSVWTLASHFFNWAIGDGGLLQRFPEHRYWSFPNLPETMCLVLPLAFLRGGSTMMTVLLCWIPLCLAADVLVDCCNRSEFRHRCRLLQKGTGTTRDEDTRDGSLARASWDRPFLFYLASHVVANLYVVLLECGRLYGHVTRQALWSEGFCRRFDWHCGKLPKAPGNFRQREAWKFGLFLACIVVCELCVAMAVVS